jgi:hypothetical protein
MDKKAVMNPVPGEPDHLMNLMHPASVDCCRRMEPIVLRRLRQFAVIEKL